MDIQFHPAAEEEFSAAIDWYEAREKGLGIDLASEVQACIKRAASMPQAWPEIEPGIRRVMAHRFPYGVLYAVTDKQLYVLAVMNLRRKPGYWKSRLGHV